MMLKQQKKELNVPIWEKYALTIPEAATYFEIGEQTLRSLIQQEEYNSSQKKFYFKVGAKTVIKRKIFEEYLDHATSL